ncbi:transcriptional regulator [Bacillus thuringiensis]|uniref:transcriptional regulator n=1 Tax=Bacillus thuringiensis TaxID=1428 RepID=UPI0021D692B0|nr:transcriptional regulator [Bacillus thuringiensis]MCU7679399.1 transcriptional regulator [Bacillus thuringiensis]
MNTITKKNSWTKADDLLLATTVLSYVERGDTQIAACDYIAKQINKSSGAARFRWNSKLRKEYTTELSKAKIDKSRKDKNPKRDPESPNKEPVYTQCIRPNYIIAPILKQMEHNLNELNSYLINLEDKDVQIESLQNENRELVSKINKYKEDYEVLKTKCSDLESVVIKIKQLMQAEYK